MDVPRYNNTKQNRINSTELKSNKEIITVTVDKSTKVKPRLKINSPGWQPSILRLML